MCRPLIMKKLLIPALFATLLSTSAFAQVAPSVKAQPLPVPQAQTAPSAAPAPMGQGPRMAGHEGHRMDGVHGDGRRSPHDMDGDGVPNRRDRDMDGDGVRNRYDKDMNGDGRPDFHGKKPVQFKKFKEESLAVLAIRMQHLTQQKACVTKAQSFLQLKACGLEDDNPITLGRFEGLPR